MGSLLKILAICILPIVTCQYQQKPQQPEQHDFLDIQSPEFFTYTPSPLSRPESLQSRPYFDFLSTLYRHDSGKSSLFTRYPKSKRDITNENSGYRHRRDVELSPILDALQGDSLQASNHHKRAIVFRPLFVYRQQQIKKQKLNAEKRRRY